MRNCRKKPDNLPTFNHSCGLVIPLLSCVLLACVGAEDVTGNNSDPPATPPLCPVTLGDTASHRPRAQFSDYTNIPNVIVPELLEVWQCRPWDWDGDHTRCIDRALELAYMRKTRYVGLTRGRKYNYSGRIYLREGTALGAVGDPDAPRPILQATRPVRGGIALSSNTEVRNLDIRGPYYNISHYEVHKHDDWENMGLNGGGTRNWAVLGTSVNGFAGTGILAGQSDSVRIEGNTIAYNGYSGISLFSGSVHCGRGVRVADNLVEHNGQNGIDACSSDARYENNVLRYNGWDEQPGDGHGLLIFIWSEGTAENIVIENNLSYGNRESGILIDGREIQNVVVRENVLIDNGQWGISLGSRNGRLIDVVVENNKCVGNPFGCIMKQYVPNARYGLEIVCE